MTVVGISSPERRAIVAFSPIFLNRKGHSVDFMGGPHGHQLSGQQDTGQIPHDLVTEGDLNKYAMDTQEAGDKTF